ncbi:MAG: hypothetical protein ACQET5_09030 [Halobacteriota archaeon]|uniref:DUF5789 family protein n=1 Tax=Natronomonas sp. TaxID=2184060 RepID=UPI003974C5F2
MGVRPPQQSDDGGPEIVAFGIAALDEHLEGSDVIFPMTSDELLETVGDPSIPYDVAGSEVRLSEVLQETPKSRFETRQEFMNALHPVFEAYRERANNSLVGRLRSLLPF